MRIRGKETREAVVEVDEIHLINELQRKWIALTKPAGYGLSDRTPNNWQITTRVDVDDWEHKRGPLLNVQEKLMVAAFDDLKKIIQTGKGLDESEILKNIPKES